MARLLAAADGLLTGSVWAPASAGTNAELDAENASQALTTSPIDSASFVLPAEEVDGIAIKLASRAAGTPTNTITVTLRNVTAGADAFSVTIDVADLPECSTSTREGGWHLFVTGSPVTPNGTDSYAVRVVMNSTSTAVQLWRNATTNNWSRLIRRTGLTTPSAADRFVIAREKTGAGAGTDRAITMDNTASTVFGSATGLSTSAFTSGGAINLAMSVCDGGSLTWGTTAATAYLLRLTGGLIVYSGGTYLMGSSGAEIPRDSTAILEFVMSATGDSKLGATNGAVFRAHGLSRTSGKDVTWCLLNTDEAASQTVLGVDTDTGWLAGDEIGIASTSRTNTHAERRFLNANAGASSLEVTVGLTNAHGGGETDPDVAAEVILLSRNVIIRSDNAARFTGMYMAPTADVSLSWMRAEFWGVTGALGVGTTDGGSYTCDYVAWVDQTNITNPLSVTSSGNNNFYMRHSVSWTTAAGAFVNIGTAIVNTDWALFDCVSIRCGTNAMTISSLMGEVHDLRASGGAQGIVISAAVQPTTLLANLVGHSNSNSGVNLSLSAQNFVLTGLKAWRNNAATVISTVTNGYFARFIVDGAVIFGNATTNLMTNPCVGNIKFRDCIIAGDTSFSTATGIATTIPNFDGPAQYRFQNCIFGAGGGVKTTHTSRDVLLGSSQALYEHIFVGCTLASTTGIEDLTDLQGCVLQVQSPNGILAGSFTRRTGKGNIAFNTTVVRSPFTVSEHLIPNTTEGSTLDSSPVRTNVEASGSVTVTVYVQKSSGYNGAFNPRLVVRANPALGIDADTVLDTLSVGDDTWEQLSGSVGPVAAEDGKLEFFVEADGDGDGAYVSDWALA